MGFTKEEMDMKVDAIMDFADIGEFIYQPVKMYSSGMFARLAFSVVINVEPDILIVDEALAVGDISFQAKCMERMKEMTERGITLLFVSHDTYAVQSLCNKAIFIHDGALKEMGNVDDVTSSYLTMQRELNNILLEAIAKDHKQNKDVEVSQSTTVENRLDTSGKKVLNGKESGNKKATILDFALCDKNGQEREEIVSNEEYIIKMAVKFNQNLNSFAIVCPIRSLNGVQEIGVSSSVENYIFPSVKKDEIYFVEIKSVMNIQEGVYNLVLAVEIPLKQNEIHEFAHIVENCLTFKVVWGSLKFPMKYYTAGEISYQKSNQGIFYG